MKKLAVTVMVTHSQTKVQEFVYYEHRLQLTTITVKFGLALVGHFDAIRVVHPDKTTSVHLCPHVDLSIDETEIQKFVNDINWRDTTSRDEHGHGRYPWKNWSIYRTAVANREQFNTGRTIRKLLKTARRVTIANQVAYRISESYRLATKTRLHILKSCDHLVLTNLDVDISAPSSKFANHVKISLVISRSTDKVFIGYELTGKHCPTTLPAARELIMTKVFPSVYACISASVVSIHSGPHGIMLTLSTVEDLVLDLFEPRHSAQADVPVAVLPANQIVALQSAIESIEKGDPEKARMMLRVFLKHISTASGARVLTQYHVDVLIPHHIQQSGMVRPRSLSDALNEA